MTPEEIEKCKELIDTPITEENVNQPIKPFFPAKQEEHVPDTEGYGGSDFPQE